MKIDDNGECLSVLKGGSEHRGLSKSKRFVKSKVKFNTCGKLGHFMRDCPEKMGNDDFIRL